MWRWISNEIKFTLVFVIVLLLFILIIIKYLLQLKYWVVTYIIHQLTSRDQTDDRVTKQCSVLPSKKITGGDKTSLCLLQSSHSNDNKYQVFELSCISRITVRGQQGFAVTLNHNPTDGAQVSKFCNLIYANNLPLSLERSLLFLAPHTASLSSLYLPLLVCPYLARKKTDKQISPIYTAG